MIFSLSSTPDYGYGGPHVNSAYHLSFLESDIMQERLRILVVGKGGREHALVWKLSESPLVDLIHVAPGNGGTEETTDRGIVKNVDICVDDFAGLTSHATKNAINLVVVGPEAPLVAGISDAFRAVGIRCFGPSKAAARLEGSKSFSKDFMRRHNIPTAAYHNFSDYEAARKHLDSVDYRVVIKADGLAAGKGVEMPESKEEAHAALKKIMVDRLFGEAGNEVVIEEYLEGDELSVLTFSDGHITRSLPPAQDHKRILDHDEGPNTGGMGCYAPTKTASKQLILDMDIIIQRTIDCVRRDGTAFVGLLFTGFMITKGGPKVLEYNVRGGDPETQTLLPLLSSETDLAKVMRACTENCLDSVELKINETFSATVVASAEGYPGSYAKNRIISLRMPSNDTRIFHAGTSIVGGKLLTTGGRVIAATSTAETLEAAVDQAYEGMKTIHFDGMHFRKDIAHRAFRSQPEESMTYASAGVSIDDGNALVQQIKAAVKSTAIPGADGSIGGFAGTFSLFKAGFHPDSPTLVMCTDGIGTKLKLAFTMDKHDTIGIDLVAMNVNDLIVTGAKPLMFVDYYACSKLYVSIAKSFVDGVAAGCRESACVLAGGETAEMPGLYSGTDYDACGAALGAIDTGRGQKILPDKSAMCEGDVLLGLASSGAHSNGFSLINRIIARKQLAHSDPAPWNSSTTVGLSLLTPTRIYVKSLLKAVSRDLIKGMSHITGGGLLENVPRMLPDDLAAEIDVGSWNRPQMFDWLQKAGNVSSIEMSRVLNNGVGMVLAISKEVSEEVAMMLQEAGETVYTIGRLGKRGPKGEGCILQGLENWDQ
jgi:phosphoribosylamine--glycine ligase / phosphoribosylformylglycinamidine cyclo-ligase